MMGTREPLKGGDEWDYLTLRGKRYCAKRAGTRRIIKAKFWRRTRKRHRLEVADNSR